jgi:hypothetical protein
MWIGEWLAVVREEFGTIVPGWRLVFTLGRAAMGFRLAHWRDRRRRLGRCRVCPVFDAQLKRCRPQSGSGLGCGCYAPLMVLVKRHGWMTEVWPAKAKEMGVCW